MKTFVIIFSILIIIGCLLAFSGCLGPRAPEKPNQKLAEFVDLERFMGLWYVHGYTPTAIDKNAFDATESYEIGKGGRILTTYRFRKGGHDGPEKTFNPVATVYDEKTNAEWRMRFFGVINAPYYIVYVDDEYDYTIIGNPNKKLAWIMSRQSAISDDRYEGLVSELKQREYDLSNLQRVAHK